MNLIDYTKQFSIQTGSYEGGRKRYDSVGTSTLKGSGIGAGIGAITNLVSKTKNPYIIAGSGILGGLIGFAVGVENKSRYTRKDSYSTVDLINQIINYYKTSEYEVVRDSTALLNSKGIFIDKKPEAFDVSLFATNGHLIIYIDGSAKKAINYFNGAMDDICRKYHQASYTAKQFNKGYLVDFICPSLEWAHSIVNGLIYNNITLNILVTATKYLDK